MGGEADKVTGKVKEGVGKVTGDKSLEAEGKGQNLGGKVAGAAQSVTDTVTGAAAGLKDAVTGKK